jgi:hypothetical protein
MKNVLLLIFSFASSFVLFNSVLAQSSAETKSTLVRDASLAGQKKEDVASEIRRLENELARAVVARDYTALQRIEADTYVYTDSDAVVTTRDEFIHDYKVGTSKVSALRFDDMTVDSYSDAAVVRGLLTVERETNGVKISRLSRYTRLYIRFPDGWRAVAGHSSSLKTAQK